METVVKAVSEVALAVTRVVVDAQNMERKAMMESLKQSLSDSVHAQIQWKVLTQQLTHERAVWHFPHSYPRSLLFIFVLSSSKIMETINLSLIQINVPPLVQCCRIKGLVKLINYLL